MVCKRRRPRIMSSLRSHMHCSGGSRISRWGGGGALTRLGGANLQHVHFLPKMYAKTKEMDPVGGGGAHASGTPLDLPMHWYQMVRPSLFSSLCTVSIVLHTCRHVACSHLYTLFLCQYRKRTDIYYSTWSFENVAKNCQFQFLDTPPNIVASFSF